MGRQSPGPRLAQGGSVGGGLSVGPRVRQAEAWRPLQGPGRAGPGQDVLWGTRGFTFTFSSDSKGDSILGRGQSGWPHLKGARLLSLVSVC